MRQPGARTISRPPKPCQATYQTQLMAGPHRATGLKPGAPQYDMPGERRRAPPARASRPPARAAHGRRAPAAATRPLRLDGCNGIARGPKTPAARTFGLGMVGLSRSLPKPSLSKPWQITIPEIPGALPIFKPDTCPLRAQWSRRLHASPRVKQKAVSAPGPSV